ncbi:hypothetical protein M077_2187 [Bacteroides fragilis str. 2-F-2 |nr:hypothetical protein M077_2187 [Bacteroides fragilis str. 2-F-2 \
MCRKKRDFLIGELLSEGWLENEKKQMALPSVSDNCHCSPTLFRFSFLIKL